MNPVKKGWLWIRADPAADQGSQVSWVSWRGAARP